MRKKDPTHLCISNGMFWTAIMAVFMMTAIIWHPMEGIATLTEEEPKKYGVQGREVKGDIIIEGEVTRVQGDFIGKDFSQMKDRRYVVQTAYGMEWDLQVGENTRKIGDIFVGDQVKASVGQDGSVQIVQKVVQDEANVKHAMIRRSIKGMLEKRNGNFLYVKQGDHTEIVHLDPHSVLEGNIQEGTKIVAQLGDAGYGIKIQELKGDGD
jgi:hypothetical protein